MLEGTALYADAKAYVKAEEKYHVNAVFLMGIAAHESAWGTSRRAREDNNLTGYGVTSDMPKELIRQPKKKDFLATARDFT
ncbi:MAG: glucosaminidase domain-containing protein [Anaerostipes hadrus]